MKPQFTKKELKNLSENMIHSIYTCELHFSTGQKFLEQEINDNVSNTIDSSATVNPANYY